MTGNFTNFVRIANPKLSKLMSAEKPYQSFNGGKNDYQHIFGITKHFYA
jgi:hypothetical protein